MEYFSGVFNDDLRHERWIKRAEVGANIQVKKDFDPKNVDPKSFPRSDVFSCPEQLNR